MNLSFLELVGLAGGIVVVTAYLPQIIHLFKVKDSTGISFWAWLVWGIGNLLLLVYAISIRDRVYTILETLSTSSIIFILVLTQKYKRKKHE